MVNTWLTNSGTLKIEHHEEQKKSINIIFKVWIIFWFNFELSENMEKNKEFLRVIMGS